MKMFLLGLKIAMFICVSVLFSPLIQAQQQLTAEERVEAQELGLEVWNGRPAVFKICPDAETDQPQE
ncbi:MAG: hypothetical protein ABGX72_07445 [Methyloprofundus sp.]